ncbi:unnamed protein product [Cylicocyclus nassatus]|uniref:SCP domain-containing protein n=1 Tax=Cylicocyclus nassatus TaxID=53992 RepID=A0AA36M184_CYLNA|nr:unnamed protein product [Cylicocyclus nassatus]
MRHLSTWLLLLSSCVSLSIEKCPDYEMDTDGYNYVELHNDIRQGVAKRSFPYPQKDGVEIEYSKKGTKSLFRLTYSSVLEGIAMAVIDEEKCKLKNQEVQDAYNKPINFARQRVNNNQNKKQVAQAYQWAIEDWRDTATLPLTDAIYNDDGMKPFANMIYYKSLQVGCSHSPCVGSTDKVAIACVYSEFPKVGEPLYLENSTKTGCTKKWCKEIVSDADCLKYDSTKDDASQEDTAGLCCTAAEKIDETTTMKVTTTAAQTSTQADTTTSAAETTTPAAETTTPAAETTTPAAETTTPAAETTTPAAETTTPAQTSSTAQPTTTQGSSGCMTEDIRTQVITSFNEKRSSLAKGEVQNGPASAGKGKLSPAQNMYEMSYDTELENEAQTWVSTCPPSPGKSELSTRVGHGETTTIIGDKTTSCADSIKQALEAWWNEIEKKALNSAVKYTQVLEQSANAPTNFTQMAWAASYKVGCAVGNCEYGNLVVCRYYVRGNIYSEYIYRIGTTCGACSSKCTNGLCKAPS